jgi:peptidoglycan/LPS O-acetylase OafA/YrhL
MEYAKAASSSKARVHYSVLDSLRGLAAISVCLFHFSNGSNLTKFYSAHLAHAFSYGYLGVEAFFVISGFVIPYSLYNTDYQISKFGNYFLKRAARICPPAYVNLLLILTQWVWVDYVLHHASGHLASVTLPQVLANLLFVVPFTSHRWLNGVFWTLALEFQFYVVVGLLFTHIFASNAFYRLLIIGVALSLAAYLPGLPSQNYLQYNSFFMLGGATLLYKSQDVSLYEYLALLAVFSGITCIIISPLTMVLALATALCIAFVKLQHPVLSFFGKISYSLYLTHFLAGSTSEFIFSAIYRPSSELGNGIAILLCFGAALVVAYGFFIVVEKPFIKLSKRYIL